MAEQRPLAGHQGASGLILETVGQGEKTLDILDAITPEEMPDPDSGDIVLLTDKLPRSARHGGQWLKPKRPGPRQPWSPFRTAWRSGSWPFPPCSGRPVERGLYFFRFQLQRAGPGGLQPGSDPAQKNARVTAALHDLFLKTDIKPDPGG